MMHMWKNKTMDEVKTIVWTSKFSWTGRAAKKVGPDKWIMGSRSLTLAELEKILASQAVKNSIIAF